MQLAGFNLHFIRLVYFLFAIVFSFYPQKVSFSQSVFFRSLSPSCRLFLTRCQSHEKSIKGDTAAKKLDDDVTKLSTTTFFRK